MRATPLLVASLLGVALAGCTGDRAGEQESTDDALGRTRGIVASVPEDATRVSVEVRVTTRMTPNVEVILEEDDRTPIDKAEFMVTNGSVTRTMEVEGNGRNVLAVLVIVTRGDATVDVLVHSEQSDGSSLLLRQERFVFGPNAAA